MLLPVVLSQFLKTFIWLYTDRQF